MSYYLQEKYKLHLIDYVIKRTFDLDMIKRITLESIDVYIKLNQYVFPTLVYPNKRLTKSQILENLLHQYAKKQEEKQLKKDNPNG